MPTRRVLNGVLGNFLGTFASRYSEYDGYWLFGFLVNSLERAEFDLLASSACVPDGPFTVAGNLAASKFADQLGKSMLDLRNVQVARLTIERLPDDRSVQGHHFRSGYNLRFRATATADTGRRYEQVKVVFVAPHDPRLESRSARAG